MRRYETEKCGVSMKKFWIRRTFLSLLLIEGCKVVSVEIY